MKSNHMSSRHEKWDNKATCVLWLDVVEALFGDLFRRYHSGFVAQIYRGLEIPFPRLKMVFYYLW